MAGDSGVLRVVTGLNKHLADDKTPMIDTETTMIDITDTEAAITERHERLFLCRP